MDFYHLRENIELLELKIVINIQLLKTRLHSLKTASKNVAHKTSEFIGNKIADAVAKSNDDKIVKPDENSRNVEEIIILPGKKKKY